MIESPTDEENPTVDPSEDETISSDGTRTSDRKSDKKPSIFYRARRNVARNWVRFFGLVIAGVWIYLSVSWYNQADRISGELSKSELEINSLWEQLALLDERDIARRQDLSTYSHSKARRTVNEKEGYQGTGPMQRLSLRLVYRNTTVSI